MNTSLINSTNTKISVIPAMHREINESFIPQDLFMSWTVQSLIQNTIYLDLKFDNPYAISPLLVQDQL